MGSEPRKTVSPIIPTVLRRRSEIQRELRSSPLVRCPKTVRVGDFLGWFIAVKERFVLRRD